MSDAIIDFSVLESSITGLKTGRCNLSFFDEKDFYRQITEKKFDLCRLKVSAEDEFVTQRLHRTGLPYFFSGSIRKYKTRIADDPRVYYKYPHLVYEVYDGTREKLLRDMLVGTWGQYPIGYYRTPYTQHLITKEQEIECVFQYYKKYNLNRDYPNNKMIFVKDGDNYVGVFSLNIVDNTLECNLAGILEPYRKNGYFLDEMNFKKEYCIKNNLAYFTFGARNENASVQRLFQYLGFQTIGNDNVFHIPSLLTYSQRPVIVKDIRSDEADAIEIQKKLYIEACLVVKSMFGRHAAVSVHLNNVHELLKAKSLQIRFSFPVIGKEEALVVIQNEGEGNSSFTGYVKIAL